MGLTLFCSTTPDLVDRRTPRLIIWELIISYFCRYDFLGFKSVLEGERNYIFLSKDSKKKKKITKISQKIHEILRKTRSTPHRIGFLAVKQRVVFVIFRECIKRKGKKAVIQMKMCIFYILESWFMSWILNLVMAFSPVFRFPFKGSMKMEEKINFLLFLEIKIFGSHFTNL